MTYDGTKPVTGGGLIAADIRENFRALKEDAIVHAGSIQDGTLSFASFGNIYSSGSLLLAEAPTERSTTNTSATKVKEIRVPFAGTYRISFKLQGSYNQYSVYGRVYRNGSPVGSLQSHAWTNGYVTYTENISGWSPNDLCQLYIWKQSIYTEVEAKDFQLMAANIINPQVLVD